MAEKNRSDSCLITIQRTPCDNILDETTVQMAVEAFFDVKCELRWGRDPRLLPMD